MIIIRRTTLIAKAFVAGAIAVLTGTGVATPALADPATFDEISCSCQAPARQVGPVVQDQISQGIRQGVSDLNPATPQP